jgi:hypothetical protein
MAGYYDQAEKSCLWHIERDPLKFHTPSEQRRHFESTVSAAC